MKKHKRLLVASVLIVISLLLSQCVFLEKRTDDYYVRIISPLQGDVLGLRETTRIHGEVFDLKVPRGTPNEYDPFDAPPLESHVMFLVNGLKVGEADVTLHYYNQIETASIDWIPDSPGEYDLQIFSSRPGRWAISEAVKVCVIDLSSGGEGECDIPVPSPDDFGVRIIEPPQGATYILDEIDPARGIRARGLVWDEQEPFDTTRKTMIIWLIDGRQSYYWTNLWTPSRPLFEYYEPFDPWIPEEPGEHFIQIFASQPDTGRWAISDTVKVCVIDFSSEPPDGYEGECEIPERSPDAVPGPLTFSATASPDPLHYLLGWWDPIEAEYVHEWWEPLPDGCSLDDPYITFQATASDPNDDIVFVKVDIFQPITSEISRSSTLILTRESGSSLDPKIFTREVHLYQSGYFYTGLYQTFEVTWTAYAYDRSGNIIASDGPHTLSVEPCYDAVVAPFSAPFPTEGPESIHPAVMSCEGIRGVSIRENGLMRTNVKVPGASGEYDATLNDIPISCLFYEAYPDTLLCDSPKPQGNTLATLIIFDDQGQEFCNQTFTVPGQSAGQPDKDKDAGCTLSVDICTQQGKSFDENKCECVDIS